ncbi:MAG: ArsA family ATPase [bacterium]|nr:ArsA family ATPase [bacterium]
MKLTLFGGKGGVGKTTCASSTGLHFARAGKKTLIICTDPAHSLADSLDQVVGEAVLQVKGVANLWALEVNAEKTLDAFKLEYEDEIKNIMDTATHLDKDDIESMFKLPVPGMDELMGFKTIIDLIEQAQFDKYIVDTAPTGHALRLLNSPYLIDDWIKVMAKMRWKYRFLVKTFAGKYVPDKSDDFLMSLKKTVKRIESLLRDSSQCEFIPVTIPEPMAILETERLMQSLADFNISVQQLVVNNVMESDGCAFCRERKQGQKKYLQEIREKFGHLKINLVPLQEKPVMGIAELDRVKQYICV